MKRGEKTLILVLCGLALSLGARLFAAEAAPTPYQGIVDRNVFQLRPPPPPPTNAPPVAPPPKITLTGITTILGNKRALLKWPVPAKPGQPAKEASYILAEGQGEDGVEVTEIDERAGTVRVMNHSQPQLLNFIDDGAKLVTAPAIPIALPTAVNPGVTPTVIPNPGAPGPASTIRTIPQRTMRLPSAPGVQPTANPGPVGATVFPGAASPNQPQAPQMTVEQQALMIEVQRLKAQQEGNPMARILPPTPITPRTEGGEPQAQ